MTTYILASVFVLVVLLAVVGFGLWLIVGTEVGTRRSIRLKAEQDRAAADARVVFAAGGSHGRVHRARRAGGAR